MRNFSSSSNRPLRSVIVALFIVSIAALFTACTESGSVGGAIAGSNTNIKFDTLKVTNLSVDTLLAYTGNLKFFSAGHFKDPLFGSITAAGLFKPLLASNGDTLLIDEKTNIFLNLAISQKNTYGDSLATQKFSLYKATELWRANQWKIRDNIQTGATPLTTFSVAQDTSVKVQLPDRWVSAYAKYFNSSDDNRDSTYVRNFFGLVLKPQNSNKIIAINPLNSNFLALNVDVKEPDSVITKNPRLDSLTIGFREWAYSIKRTNTTASPQSSSKLTSTYERVIRFDFNFNFNALKREEIAKVEIIFYVDKALLKTSINQAGAAAMRPASKRLNMHYIEADEIPKSFAPKPGPSYYRATYNKEDQAYHFNVTQAAINGFFKATNDKRVFYLTIGSHNGVINSGLIFNSLATGKAPRVVISYVKTKD